MKGEHSRILALMGAAVALLLLSALLARADEVADDPIVEVRMSEIREVMRMAADYDVLKDAKQRLEVEHQVLLKEFSVSNDALRNERILRMNVEKSLRVTRAWALIATTVASTLFLYPIIYSFLAP